MRRRQVASGALTIAILLRPILAVSAVLTGFATGERSQAGDPFAFLRPSIQISQSEQRKIDSGEVVVKILPGQGPEVAVFAAGALQAGGDTLIRRVRDIVDLKKSSYVPAIARFSVISVTHVTIMRGNGRSQFPEVVIASKKVFATHNTNGSLAVTMLLSNRGGSSPYYLVYVNRSAVDMVGGFLGIRRAVIEGRLQRETERLFAIQRNRIVGGTAPSVDRD